MPAPPILSSQMEPPPVAPVVEMNYVTGEYQVYEADVELNTLFYNASGDFEDIGVTPNIGLTGLHDDSSRTHLGLYPPSIRGTNLLNTVLIDAMVHSGGLTAVCEFDVSAPEINGATDDVPIFWLYRDSIWGDYNGEDGEVYWQHYMQTGVQGEGYFYDEVSPANSQYQGGSAWEGSNDRRYRLAGTWCFDLGPGVGVNRYQGGQSIDGQPQGIDTSFGHTPHSVNKNLSFMNKITASHFFGVGVDFADMAAKGGVDDGWWWWPGHGWIIRYLAFYRARPVWTLPILSRPPHTFIQVGQLYAEVIHKPVDTAIKPVPFNIEVEPLLPKMANIVVPTFYIDIVFMPLPASSIG
jgi:hypothetical protein